VDVENPLLKQLGRFFLWPNLTQSPDMRAKSDRDEQTSGGHRPRWPRRLHESLGAELPSSLRLHWDFPWFSSVVVRLIPGYSIQRRVTTRTPPPHACRLDLSD
jgi:hypothetical protein